MYFYMCACVNFSSDKGRLFVVSNTKAYQSPLDMSPPPKTKILTTRIKTKAKLWHTRMPWPCTHQSYSPKENGITKCRDGGKAAIRGAQKPPTCG